MTETEFLSQIIQDTSRFLPRFIDLLQREQISCCVIGGLAVNAYAEPVVSLDLDIVIVATQTKKLLECLPENCAVKTYPNSINLSDPASALRIQIQSDPRYQEMIARATRKNVLGYPLPVAAIADVFQGKVWAAGDKQRRPSKRQKDLADIARLLEIEPQLISLLPIELKQRLEM